MIASINQDILLAKDYHTNHRILINPYDPRIKTILNTTFEYGNMNGNRFILDSSIDGLPDYSSDCVWSVRHNKNPLTDIKIKLKAMEAQTRNNLGEEIFISLQN